MKEAAVEARSDMNDGQKKIEGTMAAERVVAREAHRELLQLLSTTHTMNQNQDQRDYNANRGNREEPSENETPQKYRATQFPALRQNVNPPTTDPNIKWPHMPSRQETHTMWDEIPTASDANRSGEKSGPIQMSSQYFYIPKMGPIKKFRSIQVDEELGGESPMIRGYNRYGREAGRIVQISCNTVVESEFCTG